MTATDKDTFGVWLHKLLLKTLDHFIIYILGVFNLSQRTIRQLNFIICVTRKLSQVSNGHLLHNGASSSGMSECKHCDSGGASLQVQRTFINNIFLITNIDESRLKCNT